MCGIFCLFRSTSLAEPKARTPLAQLRRGLALIRHRGPDDEGIACFDAGFQPLDASLSNRASVLMGFRRLSVLDLSPAGHQPMSDPSGRYVIAFNGEIYNHIELRRDLEALGERFKSSSDTEVLLRLLSLRGDTSLATLDGMFAIAMLDRHARRVLLARDHFGVKPLYLWTAPDRTIAVASEIKAFAALDGWSAQADLARCRDFLLRGIQDHTTHTMFEGVSQIPPGGLAHLTWQSDAPHCEVSIWYDLAAKVQKSTERIATTNTKPSEIVAQLLSDSVARQLHADVHVGSCLSGGIDSSAIVTLAARKRASLAGPRLRTITARPRGGATDEGAFARLVARNALADASEVMLDESDLWSRLHELVWIQDEPFPSTSIFAQSCVYREAARQGLVVMLDGQGADEVFGGYNAYLHAALGELVRSGQFRAVLHHVREVAAIHRISVAAQLARVLLHRLPPGLRRVGGSRLSPLFDCGPSDESDPEPTTTLRSLSLQQITRTNLPMLLHWEDRNSMASSIEARVPYLSPALVEFGLALDARSKICGATTKAVLRDALRGLVPDSILERRDKVGFEAPEQSWLCADSLSPESKALIDDALHAATPLLNSRGSRVLDDIRRRRRRYDRVLWRVICLGVWAQRFSVRLR